MANCHEMQPGDTYYCATCGLELQITKSCICVTDAPPEPRCSVPLQCCGKPLQKKQ